jgi:CheY-like chemotaxis protein
MGGYQSLPREITMFDTVSSPSNVGSVRFPGRNILVADDNPVFQILMKQLAADAGMRSLVLSNGKQIMRAIAVKNYDAVILDLDMPELDGVSTIEAIRRAELRNNLDRTPILITSISHADELPDHVKGMIDGYLQKPISRGLLMASLESIFAVN